MPRVGLQGWISVVTSDKGPESDLRHVCHVLSMFMSGDGIEGCFPSVRLIGKRLGVHHATASRRLHQLRAGGWVEVEYRTVQYGRKAGRYFPALPMVHLAAPIQGLNGAPERTNAPDRSANGAPERTNANGAAALQIGAQDPPIGARDSGIGAPERDGLLLTLTQRSAAPPSPAAAGSAAPEPQPQHRTLTEDWLRKQVAGLRAIGWSDDRILAKWKHVGMTNEHLTARPAQVS